MTDTFFVVGLNHASAPVAVRERLAFDDRRLPEALERLRSEFPVAEAVILSTCNRVEIYAQLAGTSEAGPRILADFLALFHNLSTFEFADKLYAYSGAEALRHLFGVIASVDSMVVGETEIVAQVKSAYETARRAGAVGGAFHFVFQRALALAKEVRTRTAISRRKVSVSTVATDLAGRVLSDFTGKAVLVVGGGRMGEATLKSFLARGARRVLVACRRIENARRIAKRYAGAPVPIAELEAALAKADIVVCSTAAPHYVIHPEPVRAAQRARRGRPLILIDIAVPRDVDPAVAEIENVYVYNIDDLRQVSDEGRRSREKEIAASRALIDREADAAFRELRTLDLAAGIQSVRTRLKKLKDEEVDRLFERHKHLDPEHRAEIAYMAERLLNKILHQPLAALNRQARAGRGAEALRHFESFFGSGESRPKNAD